MTSTRRYQRGQLPPVHPPDQLLTTDALARYLDVSAGTIRWWRREGTGPELVYAGRHARYKIADVEAWMNREKDA